MDITPLPRNPPLASRVADRMLASIAVGDPSPGQWLPSERDLSDGFGVSRTVIREAVRRLEQRGVVEVLPGQGARVLPMTSARAGSQAPAASVGLLWGAAEVDEVRAAIEDRLQELAVERATDDDVRALRAALRAMTDAVTRYEAASRDAEFLRLLARATRNALFVTMVDSLNTVVRPLRERGLANAASRRAAIERHAAVVEALEHS